VFAVLSSAHGSTFAFYSVSAVVRAQPAVKRITEYFPGMCCPHFLGGVPRTVCDDICDERKVLLYILKTDLHGTWYRDRTVSA